MATSGLQHPRNSCSPAFDDALVNCYFVHVDCRKLITIDPARRSGKACIRGLRMTVQDVLEYLASGMSADDILADFPDLTREDIFACLSYAADRERRLGTPPA